MAEEMFMYYVAGGIFVALAILLGAARGRRPKGEMVASEDHGGAGHSHDSGHGSGGKKIKKYGSDGKPIS